MAKHLSALRIVAVSLGVVALASVAIGWLQYPSHITAAEARAVAKGAFEAAGVDAVIDPEPTLGFFTAEGDDERVRVWRTSAEIDGGIVELWVQRSDGLAVFIDARTPDGSRELLTEDQFARIERFADNPAEGRQIRRNVALTAAAALIVVITIRVLDASTRLPSWTPALRPPLGPTAPPGPGARQRPLRAQPLLAAEESP
ncbi:MAG: hypothetical protein ACOYXM_10555 [Actinomycetota bacterium]